MEICRKQILSNDYAIQALQISYARVTATIPQRLAGKPDEQFELFCYPEFNAVRNQVEPRTLDYSHILTNMRSHISTKRYDFYPKEHFFQLCEECPDILSKLWWWIELMLRMYSQQ